MPQGTGVMVEVKQRKRELVLRTLSAVVLVPLFLWVVLKGVPSVKLAVVVGLVFLMLAEWEHMVSHRSLDVGIIYHWPDLVVVMALIGFSLLPMVWTAIIFFISFVMRMKPIFLKNHKNKKYDGYIAAVLVVLLLIFNQNEMLDHLSFEQKPLYRLVNLINAVFDHFAMMTTVLCSLALVVVLGTVAVALSRSSKSHDASVRQTRALNFIVRVAGTAWILAGGVCVAWQIGCIDDHISLLPVVPIVPFLILLWMNDTGAYCVGRWLGGPKFAPSVSPNKTWSGFWGGLIAGVASVLITMRFSLFGSFVSRQSLLTIFIFGILISLSAHMSDLLESTAKRFYGVKDSGTLIPGHGGLLDRLDSMWGAAITLFLLSTVVRWIEGLV